MATDVPVRANDRFYVQQQDMAPEEARVDNI